MERNPCFIKYEAQYNCRECLFSTQSFIELKNHSQNDKQGESLESLQQQQECKVCEFKTYSQFMYLVHLAQGTCRKILDEVKKNEELKYDFTTMSKVNLNEHALNTHSSLDFHLKLKHLDPTNLEAIKWFKCDMCDYQTKNSLTRHISRAHNKGSFKCEHCDKSFKNKRNLVLHIKALHTPGDQIPWYGCKHCRFRSKLKGAVRRHLQRMHLNHDIGSQEIIDLNSVPKKGPPKSMSKLIFQCEECGLTFKIKQTLQKHIICKHTPDEEIKWFHCDECEFKAKIKEYLELHVRCKHSSQMHKCDKCGYQGKGSYQLKQHIYRIHTAREGHCEICDYKGNSKEDLLCHLRSAHFFE